MKTPPIMTALIAATLAAAPFSLKAEENEKIVKLSEIPPAAATALKKHAAGGEIVKVEQEEEKQHVSYEAKIKTQNRVTEVSVDAHGKLLSVEEVIASTDAPAAVRAAIEKESGGGKVEKVERVHEGGRTTFEVVIASKGKREEVVFSETGKVVGREKKD